MPRMSDAIKNMNNKIIDKVTESVENAQKTMSSYEAPKIEEITFDTTDKNKEREDRINEFNELKEKADQLMGRTVDAVTNSVNESVNEVIGSDDNIYYNSDQTELIKPKNDGPFGEFSINSNRYGGNQEALYYDMDYWLKDPKALEIIQKYYPEATTEDIELLFYRMKRSGCTYVADINSIVQEYANFKSESEFRDKFGFDLYELVRDDDGKLEKNFNYEYLLLDYYLYVAKNINNYDTIKATIGNSAMEYLQNEIVENIKNNIVGNNNSSSNGDAALDDDEFEEKGMTGRMNPFISNDFSKYAKDHDINVDIYDRYTYTIEPGTRVYQKMLDEIPEGDYKDYLMENQEPFYLPAKYLDQELIRNIMQSGGQLTVDSQDFPLYLSYDRDGNGKLDDVWVDSVGAHAMTVTGTTSDPDKIIVSSWGYEFVMDVSDIDDYNVYYYD